MMSTGTTAHAATQLSAGRAMSTVLAMWVAVLGIDGLFHAGLLARFWANPGPALLPTELLFKRIPFAYASFLLTLGLFFWLEHKTGARGAGAGARFGAIFGGVLGAAGGLGMFSAVPLGVDFLAGIAVSQLVQYTIAGAIGGLALARRGAGRIWAIAIGTLVGGLAIAIAIQNLGLIPPMR